MKLKKYSKYKQSGIDWIGEIPEEWKVRKIKNIGNISTSSVDKKSDPNERSIKLLNYMDIYSSKDKKITKDIDFMKVTIKPSQYVSSNLKIGDLLFTPSSETSDDIGHSAVIMEKLKGVVYSYHILRLRFNNNENINTDYKRYIFNNYYFLNQLSSKATGTTRMTLGLHDFKDSSFVLPSLQTQNKISSFLDSKTLQIENLIEKDKKLIELLKEKRVSLINKSVTRGLDSSVRMKDSGVEWIGEIPESWNFIKFSRVSDIRDGTHDSPSYVDEITGVPFVTSKDIKNGKIDFSGVKYVSKDDHIKIKQRSFVEKGDILMPMIGTVGNPCIVDTDLSFSIKNVALFKKRKINLNFLFYYLLSPTCKSFIDLKLSGGIQSFIGLEDIRALPVISPEVQEQQKIVDYLDKKTQKIDNHIKKVEERIKLYDEYKKSVIYNVVTGKVEV